LGCNSIEDHPLTESYKHLVDGALVGVGSLWLVRCIVGVFGVLGIEFA